MSRNEHADENKMKANTRLSATREEKNVLESNTIVGELSSAKCDKTKKNTARIDVALVPVVLKSIHPVLIPSSLSPSNWVQLPLFWDK